MSDEAPTVIAVTELSRGGFYVRTGRGPVQFGMPPETIKDVMAQKLDVPIAYVLPRELFDRRRGISVAEFEFPAYYNFFLLKRRCRLVVESKDVEQRVRSVFQETLFGPKDEPHPSEFAEGFPLDGRPNFHRESEYFRQQPGRARLEVDDLVEFVHYENGRAQIADGVYVVMDEERYVLEEDSAVVAAIPRVIQLPARKRDQDQTIPPFTSPTFGVTVLGNSHGFDPAGKTTGFLLWIGKRALLVDPPTDATEYLQACGVPPKVIDGVILTHCHADHDAGTFQKLLEEGQVALYTTPHILGSFLRKYSALSGLSEDTLRRTFVFYPARIGAPTEFRGGELWFRYSLHSIPAIGVEAFYGGRSIAISGDTLYDPERLTAMRDAKVFGEARFDDLVSFRSHHSVYLHEAGIPPIHTPVKALAELPEEVKKRLFLVHIAEKDVPRELGLLPAPVGLDQTMEVVTAQSPEFADAIGLLDAVCMVDFMRELPLSRARSLLSAAQRYSLPAGEKIVAEGTRGDSFYILASGQVSVVKGGQTLKTYRAGDYFGETALLFEKPRGADVVAKTEVDLIAIDKNEFLSLLRGTEVPERLMQLARARDEGAWETLEKNSVLRTLSSGQRTQLGSFLDFTHVEAGDVLWRAGEPAERACLVGDAQVTVDGLKPFESGAFLADTQALRNATTASHTVRVTRKGTVFFVRRVDFVKFLDENPGVNLCFLSSRFVE